MYKIIGADQKEYGPVTIDQIRQWIRDGRVNAQTQARLDPGGQWQPLSAFAEFADAFGAPAPGAPAAPLAPTAAAPFPVGVGSREAALSAVKGPAIALIIMAALGIGLFFLGAIRNFVGGAMPHQTSPANLPPEWQSLYQSMEKMQGPAEGAVDLFFAAMNGLVLFGGIRMLRLEGRTLAMVACIVAMLPVTTSCCCILGLPFGIWGLIVLNKPEVKSQFT